MKLPEDVFLLIEESLENIYVDIDEENNMKEKIEHCNQNLQNTHYFISVTYEDTYCANAYFLSVVKNKG